MPSQKFDCICSVCGFPMYRSQVGAVDECATILDFAERRYVDIDTLIFCPECWNKIKDTRKGGMRLAMKKYREVCSMDKKDGAGKKDTRGVEVA